MTMGFLGALIFSLVFFAVWSLRDCATTAGQTRNVYALCGITFLILAWALGRL